MCEVIFFSVILTLLLLCMIYTRPHYILLHLTSLSLFYPFNFPNISHLPSVQPRLRSHSILAARCVDLWYMYIYVELRP